MRRMIRLGGERVDNNGAGVVVLEDLGILDHTCDRESIGILVVGVLIAVDPSGCW